MRRPSTLGHLALAGAILGGRAPVVAASRAGWRRACELALGGIVISTLDPDGAPLAQTTIQLDGDAVTIWSSRLLDPKARASLAEAVEAHHRAMEQAVEELRQGVALVELLLSSLPFLALVAAAVGTAAGGATDWIGWLVRAGIPALLIAVRLCLAPALRRLLRRSAARLLARQLPHDLRYYLNMR